MTVNGEFMRLVPTGTKHFLVEERLHRGEPVYAVIAVTPDGPAIPVNGYSERRLAEDVARQATDLLTL